MRICAGGCTGSAERCFDTEDFKRKQKEDERSREQKRERKKEVLTADSSVLKDSEDSIHIAWKRLYSDLNKILTLELLPSSFLS